MPIPNQGDKPPQIDLITKETLVQILNPAREAILSSVYQDGALTQLGYTVQEKGLLIPLFDDVRDGEAYNYVLNDNASGWPHRAEFRSNYGYNWLNLNIQGYMGMGGFVDHEKIIYADIESLHYHIYAFRNDTNEQLSLEGFINRVLPVNRQTTRTRRLLARVPIIKSQLSFASVFSASYLDEQSQKTIIIKFKDGYTQVFQRLGIKNGFELIGEKVNVDKSQIDKALGNPDAHFTFVSDVN